MDTLKLYLWGEFLSHSLTSQDSRFLVCQTISIKQQIACPAKGKVFYSDTDYQLLGGIIDTISDKSLNTMIRLIQKVVKK